MPYLATRATCFWSALERLSWRVPLQSRLPCQFQRLLPICHQPLLICEVGFHQLVLVRPHALRGLGVALVQQATPALRPRGLCQEVIFSLLADRRPRRVVGEPRLPRPAVPAPTADLPQLAHRRLQPLRGCSAQVLPDACLPRLQLSHGSGARGLDRGWEQRLRGLWWVLLRRPHGLDNASPHTYVRPIVARCLGRCVNEGPRGARAWQPLVDRLVVFRGIVRREQLEQLVSQVDTRGADVRAGHDSMSDGNNLGSIRGRALQPITIAQRCQQCHCRLRIQLLVLVLLGERLHLTHRLRQPGICSQDRDLINDGAQTGGLSDGCREPLRDPSRT
eukprot:8255248-Lingulodinium_polyedra.AAC.2